MTNQERAANILKNFQSDIVKGGEGSKGGTVTGHTVSGKPVYEKKTGKVDKFKHHMLLAGYHVGSYKKEEDSNGEKFKHHFNESQKHVKTAKKHYSEKEHGSWEKNIPDSKEAMEYGKKHYKES